MRAVVVNDCGYVWEDLKPYLPNKGIQWIFIRRDRSFWGKTFGLTWKILRSHGDFYIVNFALQDAWLVQKFKHLDLLICHGGDIRKTIHRRLWGWMVRSNLKHAKSVAYTSEDTADATLQLRPDAFLIHRPIRTETYTPIPQPNKRLKFRAVYFRKPYDRMPTGLFTWLVANECSVATIDNGFVKHKDMPAFLREFDVFIDQTTNPDLSKLCLEAMSCGLCTITWRDRERFTERVTELLDADKRKEESEQNRKFVCENYDAKHVASECVNWIHQ